MGRENVFTKSQHKNCKQIGKNKNEINTFILSAFSKYFLFGCFYLCMVVLSKFTIKITNKMKKNLPLFLVDILVVFNASELSVTIESFYE